MGSRAQGGEGLAFDVKKDTSFSGKGSHQRVDAEAGHSPFGGGKPSEDHRMSLLFHVG